MQAETMSGEEKPTPSKTIPSPIQNLTMTVAQDLVTAAGVDTPPPTTPRGVSQLPSMVYVDFVDYEKENIKITEPTEQPDPDTSDELFPCPICNRTFHPLIFEKHASICERTAKKKRQPFDSKRQRTEGTDLANYNPPRLPGARVSHTLLSPRLTTRKQLQNTESPTVTTIASAAPKVSRNISTTSASGSSSNTPLYQRSVSESSKRPMIPPEEHCPYCGRTFCRKAFDTHVGYCKTKLLRDANKPVDPSKEVLRERMEMRQKFVPPLLNRSKRYLNRVKYSAAEAVEAREAAKNQSKNESTISVVDKELNSKTPLAKHHDSYNESVNNNNIASLNSTNSRKTTNDGNSLITSNDKIGIMSLSMTSSLTSNSNSRDYEDFNDDTIKKLRKEIENETGICLPDNIHPVFDEKPKHMNTELVLISEDMLRSSEKICSDEELLAKVLSIDKNSNSMAEEYCEDRGAQKKSSARKSLPDKSLSNTDTLEENANLLSEIEFCDEQFSDDEDSISFEVPPLDLEKSTTPRLSKFNEKLTERTDFKNSTPKSHLMQKHFNTAETLNGSNISDNNRYVSPRAAAYNEKPLNSIITLDPFKNLTPRSVALSKLNKSIETLESIEIQNRSIAHGYKDDIKTVSSLSKQNLLEINIPPFNKNSTSNELQKYENNKLMINAASLTKQNLINPSNINKRIPHQNRGLCISPTHLSSDSNIKNNLSIIEEEIDQKLLPINTLKTEHSFYKKNNFNTFEEDSMLAIVANSVKLNSRKPKVASRTENVEQTPKEHPMNQTPCKMNLNRNLNNATKLTKSEENLLNIMPTRIRLSNTCSKSEISEKKKAVTPIPAPRRKVCRAPIEEMKTFLATLPSTSQKCDNHEQYPHNDRIIPTLKLEALDMRQPQRRKKSLRPNRSSSVTPMKALPFRIEHNNNIQSSKINEQKMKFNRTCSMSGLPDYDPFLSAKRQLEELYSPTAITETFDTAMSNITNMSDSTPQPTSSTPSTPSISIPTQSKMSTSLTLSTSTPNSSPISTAMNNNQKRTSKCTTPNISNFRRSSSLRGPRRTPTLPPRPLFSYNYRPTIQRGLSDEGPISTNFLKSEEYDEMPVRSNCVNDFAITNSPRVVRRDTSASNRKHNLKLNINAANLSAENSSDERLSSASKYISKTDSLAVFLKYENELEKLNAAAAATAAAKTTTTLPNKTPDIAKLSTQQSCTDSTSAQNIQPSSPVITKELKDKSNILSKQNSVKSIKVDSKNTSNDAKPESQKTKTHLPTPVGILPSNNSTKSLLSKKVNDNISQKNNNNKLSQIRLEPISKPATPLTKPHTPKTKPNTPLISQNSTNMLTQLPAVNKPINLNEIFGEPKIKAKSICKDRKISNSSEYIDPKLINKCDNLPVNFSDICSYKHFDSDSSTQRTDSSASSTSGNAPISQLTKALPLAKIDSTKGITALKSTAPIAIQSTSSTPNALSNQRNSIDARTGQLKRKMRLGLNHFLYDASPEADDSCLADDEANRSSTEYSNQQKQHQSRRNFTARSNAEQQKDLPTNLTPLPIFDDFDFEEFLSSFENDEEQFPLFKDCREFLMNRTSKQRSTLTPNSYTNNNNNSSNKNSNSNSNSNSDSNRTLTQEPSTKPNNNIFNSNMNSPFLTQTQHFQFPTLLAKTNNISSQHLLTCTPSLKTNSNDDKREIFISIETEQNEMGRSSISPDTIRNMMGHNQSVVEIEVDPPDNKFSKISDDESLPIGSLGQLPNVQFNNAKNLMQKMQENFRQRSEEVSTGVRQAYNHNATPGNSGERRANSHISGDTYNDSDEMSSLDNYPLPRQTRRGAGTKLSADSAYGSLSRQRSSELTNQHQTLSHTRSANTKASSNNPSNTTLVDGASHAMPQHHHRYSTSKTRARQFSGSSSSESNNSLPPIGHNNNNNNNNNKTALRVNCNNNYQQQQDHQEQYYYNAADNNNNNNNIGSGNGNGNDNMRLYNKSTTNGNFESPLSSPMATSSISATQNPSYQQPEATSPGTQNAMLNSHHSNSSLSSSSNMSSSMKMSKFCHECGTKFIIEQAKFCMDCGVRRIVL